eukprot:5197827-Pleurochrysis_carterae.AAC.1
MKSFEDMCSLAHYSPGVARGRRFSSFKCACCGYLSTEKQWRWDLAKFKQLSDDAQHTKRQQHNKVGTADRKWGKHYEQVLYALPRRTQRHVARWHQ